MDRMGRDLAEGGGELSVLTGGVTDPRSTEDTQPLLGGLSHSASDSDESVLQA